MKTRIIRCILMLVLSFMCTHLMAQDFMVDMNKIEAVYAADFSKPFTISFKDNSKKKVPVVIKQGETAINVKDTDDVSTLKIAFAAVNGGLAVPDKDGKMRNLTNKPFTVVLGEKSLTVNNAKAPNRAAVDSNLVIDVKDTTTREIDFSKNFTMTFKPEDNKPQDVVITSSSGKITLRKQDLAKLTISFISEGSVLNVDDGKGKPRNGDDGKPFKADDGKFTVSVGKKNFKVSKKLAAAAGIKKETTQSDQCPPVYIVDNTMLAGIGSAGCQLCESWFAEIKSKNDSKINTDYIVLYDPMLRKDAYTVCKHYFEKLPSAGQSAPKYRERFIRVRNKFFAPAAGSQIRFEVVNLPLNSNFKLLVDEKDVFNEGAAQFASVITGLVNANIITPIAGTPKATKPEDENAKINGGLDDQCLLSGIDQVAADILKYITTFRISSCAIDQHTTNMPIIFSRINERLGLSAATAEQLSAQLAQKIDAEAQAEHKVSAVKKVELIVNALKALEGLKPVAYPTLKAKNRDFIQVQYTEGSGQPSKPEYIRISGGMKIDFSAGFVLTGLRDFSYVLKQTVVNYTPPTDSTKTARDTTGNIIIKEDQGNNQVGVCVLTHFYPRMSSHYNIGGTIGLMSSTDLNLRFMLGGSLMISSLFGSDNRVSFSYGVVWGKVKRISGKDNDFFNQPRVVNGIPEFYSQASAPQPIDRTEHSWFFAVTLNFGGK